jgi:hypothetical protein
MATSDEVREFRLSDRGFDILPMPDAEPEGK